MRLFSLYNSSFQDISFGGFSKLSYMGMKLSHLQKLQKLHIYSFYPHRSKLSLFSLYGQRLQRYCLFFFKIAIFGDETWLLAKLIKISYTLSLCPNGLKLSLFSLYRQRFPRYGPIFKIAIFGHETFTALTQVTSKHLATLNLIQYSTNYRIIFNKYQLPYYIQ